MSDTENKNPKTWWVPEDHMFNNGGDCLDKFPDAGPACGLHATSSFFHMRDERDTLSTANQSLQTELKYLRDEVTKLRTERDEFKATLVHTRGGKELSRKERYDNAPLPPPEPIPDIGEGEL